MMALELLGLIACGAIGATGGYFLRLPMWPITGAILGSAAANLLSAGAATVPFGVSFFAQVLVGTAVGASVLPGFLKQLGKLILPATLVVLMLVAVGISSALIMAHMNLLPSAEALLGLVPGGVGEMVAAASALGADSALVAGIHIVRLLMSLWMLPLLVRWASTWKRPPE